MKDALYGQYLFSMLCLYIIVNEEKYYICHQNIFFNFVNLWARTQLAYKYDGNKILFVIIFSMLLRVQKKRESKHFLDVLNYLNNEKSRI